MRREWWRMASLALAVTMVTETSAWAQAPAAEALFEQGRQAMARGDYVLACARFAASDAVEPGAGVRANLAACEERRGRIASAWAAWKSALSRLPPGDERAAKAQAHIDALASRLPYVVLELAPNADRGTTVSENGTAVGGAGLYGVSLPWDSRGAHAHRADSG